MLAVYFNNCEIQQDLFEQVIKMGKIFPVLCTLQSRMAYFFYNFYIVQIFMTISITTHSL